VTRGELLEQAFVHGQNVFLCPPESPRALAEAIVTVMDDVDLRERLRAGSVELGRQWFSWDSAVERTLQELKPNNR
jgi:glycosyltransferase involved in cell wall biosynthesis